MTSIDATQLKFRCATFDRDPVRCATAYVGGVACLHTDRKCSITISSKGNKVPGEPGPLLRKPSLAKSEAGASGPADVVLQESTLMSGMASVLDFQSNQSYRLAAEMLTALDSTWDLECAFSPPSFTSPASMCAAGIELARQLPSRWPNVSWQGMTQGCPHILPAEALNGRLPRCKTPRCEAIVFSQHQYVDYCLDPPAVLDVSRIASRKRVLIILFGLHRFYRDGWAHLQETLIRTNPHVRFELALLTYPHFVCTDRDRKHGECGTIKNDRAWLNCDGPLPPVANFTAEMQRFYAPTPLVYTQFTHWGGGAYNRPLSIHRLARGWASLLSLGIAQRYDHVVAIRSDGVLTRPLELKKTCARSPGVNLIFSDSGREDLTSADERDGIPTCASIRNAEAWDLGLLACDPRALNRWLYPVWAASDLEKPWCKELGDREFAHYGLSSCSISPRSKRLGKSLNVTPAQEEECTIFQLFQRQDTNGLHLRLGSLNRSGIFIRMLSNRSDQGWSSTPTTNCIDWPREKPD